MLLPALLVGLPLLWRCGGPSAEGRTPADPSEASRAPGGGYWAQVDSVAYVGQETCGICHPGQHARYPHTGMGRSFGPATRDRSDADFTGHPVVRDADRDLAYRPFWRGDSLVVAEFRVRDGDTVHYREETVDHVIGSGHHTNSHLIERNGYLFQAPVTYYTQEGRWDLAPGFGGGFSSRFDRPIQRECITCHNGLPDPVPGSLNAYAAIPAGIDCERCHGPGAEHVRQKLAGRLVDTAVAIDYTIVHPGKLPLDAQLDLCQRCHLQGVAVLRDGASWFDFRPGDRITEHWDVFLPDFGAAVPGAESADAGGFLMASQAERLRESPCFTATGGFGCITCHNPHVTVRETPRALFNRPCHSCHGGGEDCGLAVAERAASANDCSSCHMPRTGAVDIPHVTITDHRVTVPGRRPPPGEARFAGLDCLTDPSPEALTRARGTLRFFEAFQPDPALLDTAAYWLGRAAAEGADPDALLRARLHWAWLREDHATGAALVDGRRPEAWTDAWACYRAGECLLAAAGAARALPWFARAAELLPRHPDFLLKRGNAEALAGRTAEAEASYRSALRLDERLVEAHANLGFLELQSGRGPSAEGHLRRACALDPDYLPARLHLAQWLALDGRADEARSLARRLLEAHPAAPEVRALAERVGAGT